MNLTTTDIDTLRIGLIEYERFLEETGGCDHSVNICVCHHRSILDGLGTTFHKISKGKVGWPNPRFDITEADANNSSFRKGTING